jgi:hypothetical protein
LDKLTAGAAAGDPAAARHHVDAAGVAIHVIIGGAMDVIIGGAMDVITGGAMDVITGGAKRRRHPLPPEPWTAPGGYGAVSLRRTGR